MNDQTGSKVIFYNHGAFVCAFSVQWDDGESDRTIELEAGQNATIDLVPYAAGTAPGTGARLTDNASCCARVYIAGGIDHNSGRNFNFLTSDPTTVEYTVTGGSLTPSFD